MGSRIDIGAMWAKLQYRLNFQWAVLQLARRFRVFRFLAPFYYIEEGVRCNKSFDVSVLDAKIGAMTEFARCLSKCPNSVLKTDCVGIIATSVNDKMGGHTKLICNQAKLLAEYENVLYLTHGRESQEVGSASLKLFAHIRMCDPDPYWRPDKYVQLAKQIILDHPRVLFVYINPEDVWGAYVIALVSRYSNIKIMYYHHASHFPNIGEHFAHIQLDTMPTCSYISRYHRHLHNNFASLSLLLFDYVENYRIYDEGNAAKIRSALGVTKHHQLTVTGCSSYKLFDKNGSSQYFELVRKLLERNRNVVHLVISNFSVDEEAVIKSVFAGSDSTSRLRIMRLTSDYEQYFMAADCFIDSFPIASAMTMIDLMRLRVPYVVKINRGNALWSFHEYQEPGYKYMFEEDDGVLNGIEALLKDKNERRAVTESNYNWFMRTFEGRAARACLLKLIHGSSDPESLFTTVLDAGSRSVVV